MSYPQRFRIIFQTAPQFFRDRLSAAGHDRGTKLPDLPLQEIDVRTCCKRGNPEQFRVKAHYFKGLNSDGACGAEDG